jgi:hypothetical protein
MPPAMVVRSLLGRASESSGVAKIVPLLERTRGHVLLRQGDPESARDALEASLAAANERRNLFEAALTMLSLIELDRVEGCRAAARVRERKPRAPREPQSPGRPARAAAAAIVPRSAIAGRTTVSANAERPRRPLRILRDYWLATVGFPSRHPMSMKVVKPAPNSTIHICACMFTVYGGYLAAGAVSGARVTGSTPGSSGSGGVYDRNHLAVSVVGVRGPPTGVNPTFRASTFQSFATERPHTGSSVVMDRQTLGSDHDIELDEGRRTNDKRPPPYSLLCSHSRPRPPTGPRKAPANTPSAVGAKVGGGTQRGPSIKVGIPVLGSHPTCVSRGEL